MKTRSWILILAAVALLLGGVVVWQSLTAATARTATVYVGGEVRTRLDLSADGTWRIETENGWNELTVRDGKVCVSDASCPDRDCVRCGWRNSGAPITCLPNRVSVTFDAPGTLDGITR